MLIALLVALAGYALFAASALGGPTPSVAVKKAPLSEEEMAARLKAMEDRMDDEKAKEGAKRPKKLYTQEEKRKMAEDKKKKEMEEEAAAKTKAEEEAAAAAKLAAASW